MKTVKKIVWWMVTICLLILGVLVMLSLKVIDWCDPEEGWTDEQLGVNKVELP